jgi:4-amino-4-deoxy-L-arabinose transferase-like glycosyltransferase
MEEVTWIAGILFLIQPFFQTDDMMTSNNKLVSKRVGVLLMVLWGIWTLRLGDPFFGVQDGFRTWMPAAVRNFDIYDYEEVGLSIVRDRYVRNIEDLYVYSHHPPLSVWIPALFSKVAGFNEVALRYTFPAVMMFGAAACDILVRRLYDERVAFWALLFFGITPFIAYYQTSYGHDPYGFMSLLLFAAILNEWLSQPTTWRYVILVLVTILAVLSAWPAVVFVGMLGLFGMIWGQWRHRVGIVILGIVAVVTLGVMLLLYEHWWQGSIASLLDAYVWRSSDATLRRGSESFTLVQWIVVNSRYIVLYAGVGAILLAIAGIFLMVKRRNRYANSFTFFLLLAALAYFLAFRNATYVHDYYKAFVMPALAIASAFTVVYGSRIRLLRPAIPILVLATVVQCLILVGIMVNTNHRPWLQDIVEHITAVPAPIHRIALVDNSEPRFTAIPLEFYTMRRTSHNVLIQNLDIGFDEIVMYVDCVRPQATVLAELRDEFDRYERINSMCSVYTLTAEDILEP